jgi:hypothetical protein
MELEQGQKRAAVGQKLAADSLATPRQSRSAFSPHFGHAELADQVGEEDRAVAGKRGGTFLLPQMRDVFI